MGVLMLRCPTTGRGFATGVNTDKATFERMPDAISTARCPHCGQEHWWRPNDARLLEAIPPGLWVENAQRASKVAIT
jgi:predicted RNA-binding Zn-ribbon protein involved in translation (DUF1610 family)